MEIRNKIIAFIVIVVLTINLGGCKDSFLDLHDTSTISPEVFPKSIKQINSLLTSVYGVQHNWNFLGNYWFGYTVYCLDHTIDLQYRQSETWNGILTGRAVLGDEKVSGEWQSICQGIYYANVTIEELNTYRKTALSSELQQLDFIEGQALFLRGYYMWHLQVLYGQPDLSGMGIPIIRNVPKDLVSMPVARATTAESYQAMINDFKKAAALLVGQTDNHRATSWSAKAALAKTYLFAQKSDSARIFLEDCINNSGKSLVSYNFLKNMYNSNVSYEYNSESFYEVGNMDDPNASAFGASNAGSSASVLFSLFYVNSAGQRTATGFNNEFMHDRNLARFGYNDPPLLTAVQKVNGIWKLSDSYITQQNDRRLQIGRQADGPDPRLYCAAFQPMFDTMMISGKYYKIGQYAFGPWYNLSQDPVLDPNTYYGWPLRKYQFIKGNLGLEGKYTCGANFYFIRLADIYLMYAEVLQNSDPALALEYINKVHRRAYNYNPNNVSPVDYLSLTGRTNTSSDDYLANNPLLYERWAELFGEGRWWEDVRRLKLGPKESLFYKTCAGGRPIIWRDEHYSMPIPPREFESNPLMVQNPGYGN